jgi:hypothetical protein
LIHNITFEGQNKSAVIADLMREAVEHAKRVGRDLGGGWFSRPTL